MPHPKIRSGATASVLYFAITYQPDGEAVKALLWAIGHCAALR